MPSPWRWICPLATRTQDANATMFLPAGAESTRAIVARREASAERTPLVIVYRREGGLTAEDLRRSRGDLRELRAARRSHPDVYRGVRAFDEPVASPTAMRS